MTRYVKQRDSVNCGPVLITNILKWAGNQYSWTEHKHDLMQKCGTYNNGLKFGCAQSRVQDVLEYETKRVKKGVKVIARGTPKLALIDKALRKDGTAAISYYRINKKNPEYVTGHYFLCIGQTHNFYETVNLFWNRSTITMLSRKRMSKILRPYPKHNYLWEIQKV